MHEKRKRIKRMKRKKEKMKRSTMRKRVLRNKKKYEKKKKEKKNNNEHIKKTSTENEVRGKEGNIGREKKSEANTQAGSKRRSKDCLLYTSPSPRDKRQSRMPSSA